MFVHAVWVDCLDEYRAYGFRPYIKCLKCGRMYKVTNKGRYKYVEIDKSDFDSEIVLDVLADKSVYCTPFDYD